MNWAMLSVFTLSENAYQKALDMTKAAEVAMNVADANVVSANGFARLEVNRPAAHTMA